MLGLVLGPLAGGFATSLSTLIAARIIAGVFGGPATSISLSAAALGAFLSAKLLHELRSRRLEGITTIASVSIAASLFAPWLTWVIEARVRARAVVVLAQ